MNRLQGKTIDMHFVIKYSELEHRLDPAYYIPELRELETKIKSRTKLHLRDYIIKMASGATPLISDSDKYYTDSSDGIPFIRVQNLSETCELNLEDCKYINKETHNNYLKRSKVSGGDLLVKITGVGRMAISSVAPKNFEGNINQHSVVIKTDSEETSYSLAAYLNTDIGERLASRRSTGGTRPALDYKALRSIPVIKDERLINIFKNAVRLKKQKEEEAKNLLSSIDNYLLSELGIKLPTSDDNLNHRIFTTTFSDVTGNRWDPKYIQKYIFFKELKSKYPLIALGDNLLRSPQYGANEIAIDGDPSRDVRYIRITDIDEFGGLKNDTFQTANQIEKRYVLDNQDLLFARSGSVGKCFLYNTEMGKAIFAGYLIRFKVVEKIFMPKFIFYYTFSSLYKLWVDSIQRPSVQSNINSQEYKSLLIPRPPEGIQLKICQHVDKIIENILTLKNEAQWTIINAKKEAEKIILGEAQ
jgi:hypothetical protein